MRTALNGVGTNGSVTSVCASSGESAWKAGPKRSCSVTITSSGITLISGSSRMTRSGRKRSRKLGGCQRWACQLRRR